MTMELTDIYPNLANRQYDMDSWEDTTKDELLEAIRLLGGKLKEYAGIPPLVVDLYNMADVKIQENIAAYNRKMKRLELYAKIKSLNLSDDELAIIGLSKETME